MKPRKFISTSWFAGVLSDPWGGRRQHSARAQWLLLFGFVMACAEGTPADQPTDGGAASPDSGAVPSLEWNISVVDSEKAGYQPELKRAPNGRLALAYYRRASSTGVCAQGPGQPPVLRFEVVYAEEQDDGFHPEVVTAIDLLSPKGLSLAFDDAGAPAIAFIGGAPAVRRCGASDLVLARRVGHTWQMQPLATDSTATPVFPEDVEQCASAMDQCNAGDVVGEWPSLAFVGPNPVVAFRDIHFGFTQDDEVRSDLELYDGQQVVSLDAGWGGGLYARLAVAGVEPIVAHVNPNPGPHGAGIWVVRRTRGEWVRTKISDMDRVGYRLALATFSGRAAVVFHDTEGQRLALYESDNNSQWRQETIDDRGNTGLAPSLAYDERGRPSVAYRFCGPYDPRSTDCPVDGDALYFAMREGARWIRSVVTSDRGGFDGIDTALAFDREGMPVVAYQATYFDPVSGETVRELRIAKGANR